MVSICCYRHEFVVRREDTNLSLVLGAGLTDERSVVDETVLGGGVLGLEGTEEGLLGSEDLNGGSWVLGEVDQAAGVGDEAGTNKLTNEDGEVGGDGVHAVLKVLKELLTVLVHLDDLVAELRDVEHIKVVDLHTRVPKSRQQRQSKTDGEFLLNCCLKRRKRRGNE